jgi:hypothetical protein
MTVEVFLVERESSVVRMIAQGVGNLVFQLSCLTTTYVMALTALHFLQFLSFYINTFLSSFIHV